VADGDPKGVEVRMQIATHFTNTNVPVPPFDLLTQESKVNCFVRQAPGCLK